LQGGAGIEHRHSALKPAGPMKRDGTHMLFIEMLVHLKCVMLIVDPAAERLVEWRQLLTGDIDYRSLHLRNSPKRCTFSSELG